MFVVLRDFVQADVIHISPSVTAKLYHLFKRIRSEKGSTSRVGMHVNMVALPSRDLRIMKPIDIAASNHDVFSGFK